MEKKGAFIKKWYCAPLSFLLPTSSLSIVADALSPVRPANTWAVVAGDDGTSSSTATLESCATLMERNCGESSTLVRLYWPRGDFE